MDNMNKILQAGLRRFCATAIVVLCLLTGVKAQFSEVFPGTFPGVDFGSSTWGDYNNDGYLDLLVTGYFPFVSKIYKNNAGNGFSEVFVGTLMPVGKSAAAWFDFNNDGFLDILLTGMPSANTGYSQVYVNNNGNGFAPLYPNPQTNPLLPNYYGAIACGDYDNDGFTDIVISGFYNKDNHTTRIYHNDHGTGFSLATGPGFTIEPIERSDMAFGDYDNDGYLDLVVSGANFQNSGSGMPTRSIIYHNNAGTGFTEVFQNILMPLYASSVEWADFNSDGKLDIIIAGDYACAGFAKVYLNQYPLPFLDYFTTNTGDINKINDLACGDFNNDGKMDFIVTGWINGSPNNQQATMIYRNNFPGTSPEFSIVNQLEFEQLAYGSVVPGDYDNDGDLDIFLNGWDGNILVSKLYKNSIPGGNPNNPPVNPQNLSYQLVSGGIKFSWSKGSDLETPQNGLYYNMRIGSIPGGGIPGGIDIVSPMSILPGGQRTIVDIGNANEALSKTYKLPAGNYCWSVQTIDNNFSGSQFSTEICLSFGSICGVKFNDLNGNGVRDNGEPGLPNWQIDLVGDNNYLASTFTGSDGSYCFNYLDAGGYTLSENQQNCWQQTCPAYPGTYHVTLPAGQTLNYVDFGNKYNPVNVAVVPKSPLCFGGWDGGFSFYPSGGVPNYTISVNPCPLGSGCPYTNVPPNGMSTIGSYPAGTYTITITDANGCSHTVTSTITEPPELFLSFGVTIVDCSLSSIDLAVVGGTGAYSYQWSNSVKTQDQTNVLPGTYTVTVTDANGCIKTGTVIIKPNCDYGDAPDKIASGNSSLPSYPTLIVDDGARAYITDSIRLGFVVDVIDAELDGQPHSIAQGDDQAGDADESGVNIPIFRIGPNTIIIHAWNNNWNTPVYISGWIDFNDDHVWANNSTEKIVSSLVVPPNGYSSTPIPIFCSAIFPGKFARFRISDQYDVLPDDPAGSIITHGEVEDYQVSFFPRFRIDTICVSGIIRPQPMVEIPGGMPPYSYHWTSSPPGLNSYLQSPMVAPLQSTIYHLTITDSNGQMAFGDTGVHVDSCDYGDAPENEVDAYPTTEANKGAKHLYKPGVYLGSSIDLELDGQPLTMALGDDNDLNGDDEDGVEYAQSGCMFNWMCQQITANCNGYLNAWVDFDESGTWEPNEIVYNNYKLNAGSNDLSYPFPASVHTSFQTFARYRFTKAKVEFPFPQSPDGQLNSGEVEDHAIEIVYHAPDDNVTLKILKKNVSCYGELNGAVELTSTGGVSPYSYLWNNGSTSPNLTGLAAGQYAVTVTDLIGQAAHETVTIYQFQPQTGDAGPNQYNIPDTMITLQGESPINGCGMWSILSGTDGEVSEPSNPLSNFHGLPGETYLLGWTITNNCGMMYDDMEVSFKPTIPAELPLTNVTIANGQSMCYNATQTITVAGNGSSFTVANGGSATLIGGIAIVVWPIMHVEPGGYFHAYIAPNGPWCGTKEVAIVAIPDEEASASPVHENSFFSIYPNPTTGGFSLELKGIEETAELKVEMYGILGERVFSAELQGQRKYDLTLEEKPVGVYFIRVVSGKLAGTGKIIKQ